MPSRRGRRAQRVALAIAVVAAVPACLDTPSDGLDGDGDGDQPVQLLVNASFEDRAAGWDRDGSVEVATTDELALPESQAGPWVAALGRVNDDRDSIEQLVTVPAWATALDVSGVRCFITTEPFEAEFDNFWIYLESLDGLEVEDVVGASNLDASTGGCTWSSFRYTAVDIHAGEQIRFVVEAVMDEDSPTSFAIDGLALTASP